MFSFWGLKVKRWCWTCSSWWLVTPILEMLRFHSRFESVLDWKYVVPVQGRQKPRRLDSTPKIGLSSCPHFQFFLKGKENPGPTAIKSLHFFIKSGVSLCSRKFLINNVAEDVHMVLFLIFRAA